MSTLRKIINRRLSLQYHNFIPKSSSTDRAHFEPRGKFSSTNSAHFKKDFPKSKIFDFLASLIFLFLFAYSTSFCKKFIVRSATNDKSDNKQKFSLRRFKRFSAFASLEYNNEIFMTANDFIKAVTQDDPPENLEKRILTDKDVLKILKRTPTLKNKKNLKFLHAVGNDALISYTEYLFLLCILTKPERGFHIAFEMFDTDGNETVDKDEFLMLEAVLGRGKNSTDDHVHVDADEKPGEPNSNESKSEEKGVFDWVWQKSGGIVYNPKVQDTSLLIHLFGPKGTNRLTFADFRKFMDDIQTEILEVEFREFSGGKMEISEPDFAKMLLRHAPLTNERRMAYMTRIEKKKSEKLITFDQFRIFCRFLNALDDFTIAVKLYTFADLPVSQTEFARAVKITTGFSFDAQFIDVLFKIFDVDDNGRLSYSEFIDIMKERLHRGFRTIPTSTDFWPKFKRCVREELKRY